LRKRRKRMKRNILITLIVLTTALSILSNSCNSGENKKGKAEALEEKVFPLVFAKEREKQIDIIVKDPILFARINDPDHIYIYTIWNQDKNCEVFKLSNDLEIKKRYIINNGIGPGEARNPRICGGDAHSVIFYDIAGHKFMKFDSSFKLIAEYKEKKYLGESIAGNEYLAEQQMMVGGFKQMIKFSKTPELLFEFHFRIYARKFIIDRNMIEETKLFETPYNEHWMKNKKPIFMPVSFVYFFNHIYVLDKREYRIIKMDIEGNVVKEKKFAFKSRTFSKSDREKWVETFFSKRQAKEFDFPEKLFPACWLMPIADGIAVGKCENYDPDDTGPVSADYFDPELNYLGKITIPYFRAWNNPHQGQDEAYNRFLHRKGKLYSIQWNDDDEYTITAWKVQIEEN